MHSSTSRPWNFRSELATARLTLWVNVALSVLLLSAVVVLFRPALDWAWHQVARPDRQYHILVSLCFVALCAHRLAVEKHSIRFAQKNGFATLLLVVVSIAYLLNQYYVQLNALSIALFLVFCFALLGHFVSTSTWRSCAMPLVLTVLVLPFEGYLDIFLGFPMRLLSAEAAVSVLHAIGVETISSDTVLLIDNRAAIVDIDCSGIRGFWIGGVFFCTITWIERYRIDLRLLALASLSAGLLFMGNVLRVVALVLLDLVYDQAHLAQVLHETLGLFFFSLVLLCSWCLMRRFARRRMPHAWAMNPAQTSANHAHKLSNTTLMLCVLVASAIIVLMVKPVELEVTQSQAWVLDFPSDNFIEQPLNTIETEFFASNGASAHKYSSVVEYAGVKHQASILVVLSGHWKAQHLPEHCYVAQGYKIASTDTKKISATQATDQTPFRQLGLVKSGAGKTTAFTSDYWFQTNTQTTVNYSRRVLSQIKNRDIPWAMVSVLWYDGVPIQAREQLLLNIREIVAKEIEHHG